MSDNPYAPPSAELEVPANPDGVELASRGKRLLAAIIDAAIMLAIQVPVLIAIGFYEGMAEGREPGILTILGASLGGLLVYMLINGYFLAKRGQTLGKMATKIQIVGIQDDRIIPLGRLVGLRIIPVWVVSVIPVIGSFIPLVDALFIFRKDRRCVHDLIAGTHVIDYQAEAA